MAFTPAETRLFEPLKVGNMLLQNRIVYPPLTRFRNDDEHVPLPMMVKHYADRATTPGTLIISEATAVSAAEEGERNNPGLTTEAQVAGWAKIYEAVHANGSFFFQQLWAMGRAADSEYVAERGFDYRSSSAVGLKDRKAVPRAMTEDEIQETIRSFAETAKRVVAAGGDGVEIHGAHGYLLDQFLSDRVNQRTDKWGGSIENRSRLILEVVRAVSDAIGAERVALRLSPFASYQSAEKSDIVGTYRYLIGELKAMKTPIAYLSLVEGVGDPTAILFGQPAANTDKTLDFILEDWDNLTPVLVAGAYTPESAASAVEEHYAKWDVLIGFGRIFIANPDMVFRVKNGLALSPYNRATFYLNKAELGYNDYPFSDEYLESMRA